MSQSIGKTLDELLAGEISKQQAVTKLQRQREKLINQEKLEAREEGRLAGIKIALEEMQGVIGSTYDKWEAELKSRRDGDE